MKRTSYDEDNDKQLKVKDEGTKHPRDGMLKKETVSCYPNGEKAHWIKTDAECKYKCIWSVVDYVYKVYSSILLSSTICIVDFVLEF